LWVVVGLGNPGKQYATTRHNVGFMLVQRLADKQNVKLKKRKYSVKAAQVELGHKSVLLVKPWTYMNRSGLAVKELLEWTGVKLSCLLVVYDDLDLPLGEIRIRKIGSPGTHKGMVSIAQEINSTEFPRIRIGIGPLPSGVDATDFVLADFQKGEESVIDNCLAKAEEAVALIMAKGVPHAMNRFNRKVNDDKMRVHAQKH
jgi:PTH1 family peptidyl-tRNA hydrolase